jgi:hypothetical protein
MRGRAGGSNGKGLALRRRRRRRVLAATMGWA